MEMLFGDINIGWTESGNELLITNSTQLVELPALLTRGVEIGEAAMMGATLASVIVKELVGKVASLVRRELELVSSFERDLEDMGSTLATIQAVLEDAEERCIQDKGLRDWLKKLKDTAYDAGDLLDELQAVAMVQNGGGIFGKVHSSFSPYCSQLLLCRKMAHKLRDLRERLERIAEERAKFHLNERIIQEKPMEIGDRLTTSAITASEIIGREGDKEKIMKLLLETTSEEDVSVIPIVGMAGLGKTTVAQLVFCDQRVEDIHFDLRMWVCVSVDFNLRRIIRAAIESGTGNHCDLSELEPMARRLGDILRGKRFLLVLDDVWNEKQEKWARLKDVLSSGMKGSKIVVTTRSEKVAAIMGTIPPHHLKGLSEEDCWELFKQRAFGKGGREANPRLVEIGKEIVHKCGGVPLAARALGSLMRFKSSESDWLAVRDNDIWELPEDEAEILPSLKLSYTQLPSALKQCFAYCSIFPKDYEIHKDKLIQQWIALGFITSSNGCSSLEDVGNEYFNNLIWISFLRLFEEDEDTGMVVCKMHDLVHNLAQSVAGSEVSSVKDGRASRIPKGCRYVSLTGNVDSSEIPVAVSKSLRALCYRTNSKFVELPCWAKCLRTLDLGSSWIQKLPVEKLKLLRQLDSSSTEIKMLPKSITSLPYLQSLNLSSCHNLQTLPKSIDNLRNLQTLNLSQCSRLEALPESLGSISSLRSLNLVYCSSLHTLPESISNLVNLKFLNLSYCENLLVLPESIGGLGNLQTLLLANSYIKRLPDSIGSLQNLRTLFLSYCPNLETLPPSLSKLVNLQVLNVLKCQQLYELPVGLWKMSKLKHLRNDKCYSLQGMPSRIGQLTNLQSLHMYIVGLAGCHGSIAELEHLNLVRGGLRFSCLENVKNPADAQAASLNQKQGLLWLSLSWRETLQTVKIDEENEEAVLEELIPHPNLEVLNIYGYMGAKFSNWMMGRIESSLPNLVKITLSEIHGCECLPSLGQLPLLKVLKIQSMNALRHIGEHQGNLIPYPSLEELHFQWLPNLEKWPTTLTVFEDDRSRKEVHMFPCLSMLRIHECPKLVPEPCLPPSAIELAVCNSCMTLSTPKSIETLPSAPSSRLKRLYIEDCKTAADDEWNGLQDLSPIEEFTLKNCNELHSLPAGVRNLTSLQTLLIRNCEQLAILPEWLGELKSLRSLTIWNCRKLVSLPQGLRRLSALDQLQIEGCNSTLEELCRREVGELWPYISHIRNINISTGSNDLITHAASQSTDLYTYRWDR